MSASFLRAYAQTTSSVQILTGSCVNGGIILQWYSFPNALTYKVAITDAANSLQPSLATVAATYYSQVSAPGHSYSLAVVALDANGREITQQSNTQVQCPASQNTTLSPPYNLHASRCYDYSLGVTFTLPPNATGYVIKSRGTNTGSSTEHTINFFDKLNTKTSSTLSKLTGDATYDWSMAVKYPDGVSEFVDGPRFSCWGDTLVESPNVTSSTLEQWFMITKSVPNLIGIPIFPAQQITVGDFLSKTNGSCFQIKSLSNASSITSPSTVLNTTTPLIPARGYAVICDDVFEPGEEVVSLYYNGRKITIDDIKLVLTSGWQYISSPIVSQDDSYSAEQFLTDLSNQSGFNCTQIQTNQIRITSEIAERSWYPPTPYIKGGNQDNFQITQGDGYKIFCQDTQQAPVLPTLTPTPSPTPQPQLPFEVYRFDLDRNNCLDKKDLIPIINFLKEKEVNPSITPDVILDVTQNNRVDLYDYNSLARAMYTNTRYRCRQ